MRYHLIPSARENQHRLSKRWAKNNIEKTRESTRKSARKAYWQNPDAFRQKAAEWRQRNPDKVKAMDRAWKSANKEHVNRKKREKYWACLETRAKTRRRSAKWALNNPERKKLISKIWRNKNEEHLKAKKKSYYQKNREKILKQTREWQILNPNARKEIAGRWVANNPEKRREVNAKYRQQHKKKVAEAVKRSSYFRRARRRLSLLPVMRADEDARFALWRNRCAFCGVDANHPRNRGYKRLTVEHVLALTKNGLDEADNIMPACATCNCSKSNSPVEEWYRRQPFFTEARWRKIQRHCPGAVIGQLPLAMPPSDTEAA